MSAQSLAAKIRAAREFTLEADGHAYTLRRPTDAEAAGMGQTSLLDMVRRFVSGWDHTEISLGIPGGGPDPAEFSAELWGEWVADQPHLWPLMSKAIIDSYAAHRASREDFEKK